MDRILLVEDADSLREVLCSFLESKNYEVHAYARAEDAVTAVHHNSFDCILADFKLPGMNGLEFLQVVRRLNSNVPFLLMTAYGTISIAVEAMKLGANDFIAKPFEPETLSGMLKQVTEHKHIVDRELNLKPRRNRQFLTCSPELKKLLHQARKAAAVDTSILLLGESGTGKELLARYIHEHSRRKGKPYAAVNCAALPVDLLESEFFGHEAGSYTGATQRRIGVFEYASSGTIFLDEVADMPPLLQVKLLRALQEREIKPIGSNRQVRVDPRIITATNQDPEEALESLRLRDDFYYRIAVISFKIPPLRERPDDIILLSDFFIEYFCSTTGKDRLTLTKEARQLLSRYPWPGNARELENVIERAAILAEEQIAPEHLGLKLDLDFSALQESQATLQEISAQAAKKAEVDLIQRTLNRTSGNKTMAAKLLGVSYKTLLNKVKEYELAGV